MDRQEITNPGQKMNCTRYVNFVCERERSVEGDHNTILLVWVHVYHHCSILGKQVLVKGLGSKNS